MDVFKKNRNLVITIIVLVIVNIFTLSLLWLGKPKPMNLRVDERVEDDSLRILNMLKDKLEFSNEQAEQFMGLRLEHKDKTSKLGEEIMELRKEMFDKVMYADNSTLSDSLLNLSLEKQSQIEKLTFEHFLKVKQICTPEQQKKLFEMMSKLLGPPQHEGRPPGEVSDGPPRGGAFREGPPPPPRN